jgi:CzcA family heavy metal efflux pump
VSPALLGERHARAVLFLAVALTAAGLLAALQLPVSLFPTVSFPRVQILADVGDRPADRMMVEVTRVLEEAVNTVPGLVNVRSVTSRGSCDISLNFRWGLNMDTTLVLVEGAINQIRGTLPSGAQIRVRRMDPTVFPVIAYSLTGPSTDPVALRDLALYHLRPLLVQVPGVAQVVVLGGQVREYAVDAEPDRLLAHGVSLAEVREAVARTNQISSVGRLEQDYQLYLVVATGQYPDLDAIRHTVVKTVDGTPITVGDVARVGPSLEPQWVRVTANGEPAVLVNVYQQREGSTVAIAGGIAAALAAYQPKLPPAVSLAKYYDQSELILSSMHNVRDSILVGILLGVLVLFGFLRHGRVTAIAAASVPVSIGATLLVLRACGQSLNIMTLGGMAASVGLILDDAIVVIENVMRHVHAGSAERAGAVERAVSEMTLPLVASSLCSIVVHAPLAFLTGVTGAFFAPLSLTVVAALTASFLFSLFIVPPLATRLLGADEADTADQTRAGRLARGYGRVMERVLERPALVLAVVLLCSVGSWGVYRQLESGFLPEMDEGAFVLDYFTLPGASLEETSATLARVERILRDTPEVGTYSLRTGLQLGGGVTEPNQGDFLVKLRPGRRRPIGDVMDGVRRAIESGVPGIQVAFAQLMEDLIGDLTAVPQPVEIKIFGDDLARAQTTARRVAVELRQVAGVVDIFDGIRVAGPTMNVVVNAERAGRFGLAARDVDQVIGTALAGRADTDVLVGEKLVGVRVRYAGAGRANEHDLLAARLPAGGGDSVPLGAIADIRVEPGTTEIARENLKQMVAVTARIEGSDLGGTVARIQRRLAQTVRIPPDQDVVYGGLYREQQTSFRGLLMVLGAAVALVFLVLLFAFESYRAPVVILVIDAMSLLGVLGLLWLTGTPLNVSSFMGMIMIVGIVAENAVFLIFYIERFRRDGDDLTGALVRAGRTRARPIVMTTLAAVLTLMPLALGIGAGAQMQKPLAIAVIGGFSLSVPLLLFCLPPLYALGQRPGGTTSR